jgi:pyruvate/2-oxoacid:ferredoxin oxidoreductase alpha subunit
MQAAMGQGLVAVAEAGRIWGDLTGRRYAAVEEYRLEGAEVALVAAGGVAGTAREAVDRLREEGVAAGLLRIRLFRPFPSDEITKHLSVIPRVAVVDRNCSVGSGGIFAQEIRAALHGAGADGPRVFSYLAGLGGVNVSPEHLARIARDARERVEPRHDPIVEDER